MELVREYVRLNSEAAFATLVQRHINLVYSVALRHVGIAAQAEEITQAVFVILARKAARLRPDTILDGWLYETTRLVSLSFVRGEHRRQFREQEAYMESTLQESVGDSVWHQLSPLLDEAMSRLGKKDRDAVIMRYFKEKSVREVAAALKVNDAAAQRRVHWALEKLRQFFVKRGVASTAEMCAGAIAAHAVQAAPAALAKSVTAVAMAKGAAASGSTLTLIKGALKLMAWTKAKTAIVVAASVLLAAGTVTVTVKEVEESKVDDSWRVHNWDSRVLDRASPQVRILPSKFSTTGGWGASGHDWMGIGVPASNLVMVAYHESGSRTTFATELPPGLYDFIAKLPKRSRPQDVFAALQEKIKNEFDLVGRLETGETDVLLLKVKNPNAQGLRLSTNPGEGSSVRTMPGHYVQKNEPVRTLANSLEGSFLTVPVIDQTGLSGSFDIDLAWEERDRQHPNAEALKEALLDQLGLELVPSLEPIQMLVVEKAKD